MIGLLGRLILSMGVVLGVMVLAAKVVRNRNFAGLRRGGPTTRIEVLARQPFGKNASVAVVMAAGKALVIGVTESNVTVLAEADPEDLQVEPPQQAAGPISDSNARPMAHWTGQPGGDRPALTWKTWIEQLRERTLRR
jgi:flagellar protein FliO/FliZ